MASALFFPFPRWAGFVAASASFMWSQPARGGGDPWLEPSAGNDPADLLAPDGTDRWLGPLETAGFYRHDAEPAGASGRGLWLSVSGGVAGSPGERRHVFGLLELGIGLDAWVGGRAPALSSGAGDAEVGVTEPFGVSEHARGFAEQANGRDGVDVADRNEAAAATGGTSRAPVRRSITDDGAETPIALAARASVAAPGENTPAVVTSTARQRSGCDDPRSCDPAWLAALARAAVGEALRVQGGGAELRRLDGMAARSRAAASLPEVRLGAGTSRDESLRLAPTAADPARFTRDGGRDLWLEARLIWRLDSAIFAHDEIAIMRLRAQQRDEAARLSGETLEALANWQRARLVLANDKAPPDERDAAIVRHFGAVARLDVLTDGWFSRQLARARERDEAGRSAWP